MHMGTCVGLFHVVNLILAFFFFSFFFKQKTAYATDGRLEFRLVLFRSVEEELPDPEFWRRWSALNLEADGGLSPMEPVLKETSEERRVGKECRSRWSTFD